MSFKTDEYINAQEILELKKKIKQELLRRSENDSSLKTTANAITENSPNSNELILIKDINQLISGVKSIYKDDNIKTVSTNNHISEISNLQTIVNNENGKAFTATSNCATSCAGLCKTTCVTACAKACSNNCSGGCKGGCTGSCSGGCDGCTGCSGTCSGSCRGGCSGGCSGSCKGGCSGSCQLACGHMMVNFE